MEATIETHADATALMLRKHGLQLSSLVQQLHHSKDPEHAWRFECVAHEHWRSDEPRLKANGFARSQTEALAKAEAWQPRAILVGSLDVLVSDGGNLLRAEAYVPALKLSMIQQGQYSNEWSWRIPAQDLAPLLAPILRGVDCSGMDSIELRGHYHVSLCERPGPSVDRIVTGIIDAVRKQIDASSRAAGSFFARMDGAGVRTAS